MDGNAELVKVAEMVNVPPTLIDLRSEIHALRSDLVNVRLNDRAAKQIRTRAVKRLSVVYDMLKDIEITEGVA